MDPQRLLRIVLPATSLVVIGLGGALLYSGSEIGWFLVGFGVIDLLAMPFVLRRTTGRPERDPADPSYNPYARED